MPCSSAGRLRPTSTSGSDDPFESISDFFDSGLWSAISLLLQVFVVLLWLALAYWTYQDARRRIEAPGLVAACVVAGNVVAGNVGTPLASVVGSLGSETTVICEASSFQLEDCTDFAPEAALLLTLPPTRPGRHPPFDDSVAAKLPVFARQRPGGQSASSRPRSTSPTGMSRKVTLAPSVRPRRSSVSRPMRSPLG